MSRALVALLLASCFVRGEAASGRPVAPIKTAQYELCQYLGADLIHFESIEDKFNAEIIKAKYKQWHCEKVLRSRP